jgi:hypothetical protein
VERERWGASRCRHAFVALGLTRREALRWFVQDHDIELLSKLREQYKTIDNA